MIVERPILFTGAMVREILADRKTVTRRIAKSNSGPPPTRVDREPTNGRFWIEPGGWARCPYGAPGDRLWVRETWCLAAHGDDYHIAGEPAAWRPRRDDGRWAYYAATDNDVVSVDDDNRSPWKPSIHMPRWASRLTLEVTGVRVERLHEITKEEARAEGVDAGPEGVNATRRFYELWCSINGADSWEANPWVWVVAFRRLP